MIRADTFPSYRRHRSATTAPACALALTTVALLAAAPAPGGGQEMRPGATPPGISMTIVDREYAVAGTTAREILDQMQALGPGSNWIRAPYFYRYNYRNERRTLFDGTPSTHCRSVDFQVELEVTVTYPRWRQPTDADPELVSAWDAFAGQLELWWEGIRSELTSRAREAARRVRRSEELCALINRTTRAMVEEEFNRPWKDDEDRVTLQWPPEEFRHLLNPVSASGAADPAPEATMGSPREEPPESEPERFDAVPLVTPLLDIDVAASRDLDRGGAAGLVVGVHHLDKPQFQEGFGTTSPDSDPPLAGDAPFDFTSFTEVLIATWASSLAAEGALDLHAPISDYLDGVTPELGSATLRQLLDHRAGLDNAQVPDAADWSEVLDDLDDRAMFTVPGAVFSHSRYSYPLAARILEVVTGMPLNVAISERVLEPLGLQRTSVEPPGSDTERGGLPVTHTTAGDLTRFWTAWLAGDIAGSGPEYLDAGWMETPGEYDRRFALGVWYDIVGEAPRIALMCGSSPAGYAGGFQVFPETRTVFVFWARYDLPTRPGTDQPSRERWPRQSVLSVLSRIAGALGLGDQIYRPTDLTGGVEPERTARRCAEPTASSYRVRDFGSYAPVDDWVGRYMNGEWFFELVEHEGRLASPVDPTRAPFSLRHYREDVYFTDMDIPGAPSIGFPLRLIRDPAGRRYVVVGERAYLHVGDRER